MNEYSILFLGDVVGRPGREAVLSGLETLKERYDPLFCIVNGENSASGFGITPKIAKTFFEAGFDAITLGNHAFNRKEIMGYMRGEVPMVRPANLPPGNPGRGVCEVEKSGVRLAVANISGRVFLPDYDDPFRGFDAMLEKLKTPHVLVDFHAEATSEKVAFGYHCDGRATAVLGTHTHVPTADEQVLPGGTAYITDVGMCGPLNSVIGMEKEGVLKKFRTALPSRFEVADQPGVISGVSIRVDGASGRAKGIERVRYPGAL
jgi:hypothetical protein